MSKTKQLKIGLTIENVEEIAVEQDVIDIQFNWNLVRLDDGLTKKSLDVMWLEFRDDGILKEKHKDPAIRRSLIMSPFNEFFTWQTTPIKEILEQRGDYVKFRTGNSTYELTKIKNEDKTNS